MKPGVLGLIVLFTITGFLTAQSSDLDQSSWSITTSPTFFNPFISGEIEQNEILGSSWGGSLVTEYDQTTGILPLSLRLSGHYSRGSLLPVNGTAVDGSLTEMALFIGAAKAIELSSIVSLRGYLDGGLTYGNLGGGGTPYGAIQTGVGFDFKLTESLTARLETGGLYKFGLAGGFGAGLGINYRLPAPKKESAILRKSLEYYSVEIGSIFPSLRSQYEDNPVGYATIKNTGRKPLTNLKASFIIRQYMDAPKECMTIDRLDPGKSVQVPLYALFNDSILGITEATKVSGQIIVDHKGIEETQSTTVQVYDRNALTWSDDKKAAAFVSSKDPWVLDLTGNIMATVMPARNPELTGNLQTAIAIHEGLKAYGISYMLSPNRPFAKEVVDTAAVDSLKFPRQTLGFRAGDCADLSVLYASCFEAAGIETAFVTVPGHIFIAADLGINEDQANARGMNMDDLILQSGKVWVPIETTLRNAGFREVWREAASQWKKASANNVAALYPVHDAWALYPPVGLPADGSNIKLPSSSEVLKGFQTEVTPIVKAELTSRINLLRPLEKGPSYARGMNNRGVLYAKYGFYPEAIEQFKEASKAGNPSALVNIGNLLMLQSDPSGAYNYYQQAVVKLPHNPRLQANLARAAASLGKRDEAEAALQELRELDSQLADQYAHVITISGSDSMGTRAAAVENSLFWFDIND